MDRGHDLLQASKNGGILNLLNGMSVTQYLGELWVRRHPSVNACISSLENEINNEVAYNKSLKSDAASGAA